MNTAQIVPISSWYLPFVLGIIEELDAHPTFCSYHGPPPSTEYQLMKVASIATFRKKSHDMIVTTISRVCKQRWVSSTWTSAVSQFFLLVILIGSLNSTTTIYASSRLPSHTYSNLCTRAIFCDDFENQTGSNPWGAWQVSYPNCHGTGTVTLDQTVAYNGKSSMRVDGHNGYCNHAFIGLQNAFKGLGTDLHVRFFVRHTTALPSGHVAFVAMQDTNDGGKDLRMGGQSKALQWNRESDDVTLPVQSPAGVALSVPLPTNQWECIEFEVNETQQTMSTWLNGTKVQGLYLDNTPTPDVDAQWLNSRPNWHPALADLRLGWESYGAGGDDRLWFDDVAIGSQRLGCAL
jgi:hypothetical protein